MPKFHFAINLDDGGEVSFPPREATCEGREIEKVMRAILVLYPNYTSLTLLVTRDVKPSKRGRREEEREEFDDDDLDLR